MNKYYFYLVISILLFITSFIVLALLGGIISHDSFLIHLNYLYQSVYQLLLTLFTWEKLKFYGYLLIVITILSNILCYKRQNNYTICCMFFCNSLLWGPLVFPFVHLMILVWTDSFWF